MSAGSFTRDWLEINPVDHTTFGVQPGAVREKAIDVSDRLKAFFYGFTSGETTKGVKYLEYCVQGTAPSSGVDALMMYCKDVTSKGELHVLDEDGHEIQITSGGNLNKDALPAISDAALVAALSAAMPIGTIYSNKTDSRNPAVIFGFGTWAALEGVVTVGYKSGDADFGTAGATVGVKTVTLTAAQSGVPKHSHTAPGYAGVGAVSTHFSNNTTEGSPSSTISATNENSEAAASEAHTNIQPSVVVYAWERTA